MSNYKIDYCASYRKRRYCVTLTLWPGESRQKSALYWFGPCEGRDDKVKITYQDAIDAGLLSKKLMSFFDDPSKEPTRKRLGIAKNKPIRRWDVFCKEVETGLEDAQDRVECLYDMDCDDADRRRAKRMREIAKLVAERMRELAEQTQKTDDTEIEDNVNDCDDIFELEADDVRLAPPACN